MFQKLCMNALYFPPVNNIKPNCINVLFLLLSHCSKVLNIHFYFPILNYKTESKCQTQLSSPQHKYHKHQSQSFLKTPKYMLSMKKRIKQYFSYCEIFQNLCWETIHIFCELIQNIMINCIYNIQRQFLNCHINFLIS